MKTKLYIIVLHGLLIFVCGITFLIGRQLSKYEEIINVRPRVMETLKIGEVVPPFAAKDVSTNEVFSYNGKPNKPLLIIVYLRGVPIVE